MAKFKGKYRSESHRHPYWDYSSDGIYFITVCTQNMKHLFGKIPNDEMILSAFGKIAHEEFHKSFDMRAELFLDEWILMPNHWHALITLHRSPVHTHGRAYHIENAKDLHESEKMIDIPNDLDTHGRAYVRKEEMNYRKMPVRKPKSIASFVAGYKSAVVSKIDDFIDELQLPIPKYNRYNRLWQRNYHDHIVRNAREYWNIRNYIINNPKKWNDDRFNKK